MNNVKEFSTVFFCSYKISNGGAALFSSESVPFVKVPLEWLVLKNDFANKRILLLSKYVLELEGFADCPIMGHGYETSWFTSYIRYWLNHDFYEKNFDDREKNRFIPTYISPE